MPSSKLNPDPVTPTATLGTLSSTPGPIDPARHARFNLDIHTSQSPDHDLPPQDSTHAENRLSERSDASQATLAPHAELGDVQHPPTPLSAPDSKLEGPLAAVDIEHVYVENDPREWSRRRKYWVTVIVSIGALTPTLAASIYNPAFEQLREELHASETELALSLSLFILFQGGMPVFWSAVGEIIGRKPVYLIAQTIFIVGTIVCSRANSMALLIVFRIIQACGSSAVLSLGAGTLADMFEVKERGKFMGYYYGVPLIGPAIGPLFGGALTQGASWRATFYFIAGLAGLQGVGFILYPDTWRKERSLAYQSAIKRSVARAFHVQEMADAKRRRKEAKGLKSSDPTPAPTRPTSPSQHVEIEVEDKPALGRRKWWVVGKRLAPQEESGDFKPSFRDINPLRPAFAILRNPVNLFCVLGSGIIFAGQFTIAVTAAITFADAPYNYNALHVGLVLVAFGGGNVIGSVFGGVYSDIVLARLKKRNGGIGKPEMRLKSFYPALPVMVGSFLAYAWTSEEKVNIAGPVVCLFFGGFSMMVIYSSVLAYLVDANVGRSSSAIACNSLFRGFFAFLMTEIALPIRSAIGDGGLYTLFAGLLTLSSASFIMLSFKGEAWRKNNPWTPNKDKT